jgi:hypothetical protein
MQMKTFLAILVFLHGMIHLLGFVKAYHLAEISPLKQPITKPAGLLWLAAGVAFGLSIIFLLLKKENWWMIALPALLLSQYLIVSTWQDAKFGTLANVLILLAVGFAFAQWHYFSGYQKDVKHTLTTAQSAPHQTITTADLAGLPPLVQKYLHYTGVVNTRKPSAICIEFTGAMRSKGNDWFSFASEQYNTFHIPVRLFFMKGAVKQIPAWGYHVYKNGDATMQVKLLSITPVVDQQGSELDQTETVTLFNDVCLFVPAWLVDKRIQWETLDAHSVKAVFTTNNLRISAVLVFNEEGQLVNFISDDRYDISGGSAVRRRFSTPVKNYQTLNGIRIPTYGEAVYTYPDGDFVYGKFTLTRLTYIP